MSEELNLHLGSKKKTHHSFYFIYLLLVISFISLVISKCMIEGGKLFCHGQTLKLMWFKKVMTYFGNMVYCLEAKQT